MYFCIKSSIRPRVKLVSCKSALNLLVFYYTDRSKAVDPVLVSLFVALTELGAFMRTEVLCFSVLRVASGPRVKLASCKSALTPRWFTLLTVLRRWSRCYSLSLCGLFYEAICCMFFRVSFCSCVFQSFSYFDYLAWGRES